MIGTNDDHDEATQFNRFVDKVMRYKNLETLPSVIRVQILALQN